MAYKVIPQIEFDRAVQKLLSVGLGRKSAEKVVMTLWKISQDIKQNFRQIIDSSTRTGKLKLDPRILDRFNKTLPTTVNYGIKTTATTFYSVANETVYSEYQYATEDLVPYESEDEQDLMLE